MPDMIVRLYALPPLEDGLQAALDSGIELRRPEPGEYDALVAWVHELFPSWVAELEVALAAAPPTCYVAFAAGAPVGFAAYDATCANFFGPMGVAPEHRCSGIGRALLLAALHAQREQGYAYSIIGGVGPVEYYEKLVSAQLIDGSTPGIYPERSTGEGA
ncbi:MAG: GNAT family N-acetyltransferase [Halioglobus sp.]|nr:GNAT family N-acetyltransferase [Halioglobus sp.]